MYWCCSGSRIKSLISIVVPWGGSLSVLWWFWHKLFGAITFYGQPSSSTYYNFRILRTANSGHNLFSISCGFGKIEQIISWRLLGDIMNLPLLGFGTLPLLGRPQMTFFVTTSVTAPVTDAVLLVVIAVESSSSRNRYRSARHLQHVKHF